MPLSARMTACEPISRSLRRRRCAGLCRKERQTKKAEKPVMIAAAVVLVGGAAAAYHLTAGAVLLG